MRFYWLYSFGYLGSTIGILGSTIGTLGSTIGTLGLPNAIDKLIGLAKMFLEWTNWSYFEGFLLGVPEVDIFRIAEHRRTNFRSRTLLLGNN